MSVFNQHGLFAIVSAAALLAPIAMGQQLVRDFNPTFSAQQRSSSALPLATLANGQVVFAQTTRAYGPELWVTDGTFAGTSLLLDIQPGYLGSDPSSLRVLPNGTLLFVAQTTQFGGELWRTDGTPQGTVLVRDVYPGPTGSAPRILSAVGSEFVFVADDGVTDRELWRTDGTSAGTVRIADIHSSANSSTGAMEMAPISGTEAVFSYRDAVGRWQLWRTDLTSAGTVKVVDLPVTTTLSPRGFRPFGNRALFLADNDVWGSDGTQAGTFALAPAKVVAPYVTGSTAYFFHSTSDLWQTDGTPAGTVPLASLQIANAASAEFLGQVGNHVMFAAGSLTMRELFRTDGTSAGTFRIAAIQARGNAFGAMESIRLGADLLFASFDNAGKSLWRTDGTVAGTSRISTVSATGMVPFQGGVLFQGTDPSTGAELWFTDGTAAGTSLQLDLARGLVPNGTNIRLLTKFRGEVLLLAEDNTGANFWLTDGTPAGTRRISSFAPNSFQFIGAASTGEKLVVFLSIVSQLSDFVWVYDALSEALQLVDVASVYPTFSASFCSPAALGGSVVFSGATSAAGIEPWITDGTLTGTRPIADIRPGPGPGTFGRYSSWRGRAYFRGATAASGPEPWVTDGTAAGTFQLVDTYPGAFGTANALWQPAGDLLYLGINSPAAVWGTDGTVAGTTKIDLAAAGFGGPRDLHAIGDDLILRVYTGNEWRVVTCNSNTYGFQLLPQPVAAQALLQLDDNRVLVLVETLSPFSCEVWMTDGTVSGTQFVGIWNIDISLQQAPTRITDSRVVVGMVDPFAGNMLHAFDGALTGPQPVFPWMPEGSLPRRWMRVGDKVLFTADDGVVGLELFAFDLTLLQDFVVASYGYGCPGSGSQPPRLSVTGDANASAVSVDLAVDGALPNVPVLFGLAHEDAAIAVSGCPIWLGGATTFVSVGSDPQGRAGLALPVTTALFGLRLYAQAFALDPNGPMLDFFATTAGLEIVLGP
ncbi:MAG: hypothetical protein AB8H80_23810 [Planctomycetota bacterium]